MKQRLHMKQEKGFTIVEVVIYAGLLGLILASLTSSTLSMYRLFGALRAERVIALEGDTALETITRDIRKAGSSISVPSTTTLVAGNATFSLSGDVLQRTEGTVTEDLTSRSQVTALTFYRAFDANASVNAEIITIRMTLRSGKGSLQRSRNFFASSAVRGNY